jgi:cellobiose-specific phosphotransferase system component IIA
MTTTSTSAFNSPKTSNYHNYAQAVSTEGTLDQMLDTKGLLVHGSDMLMSAETRDISKKLGPSFSNAFQDDSLDLIHPI